jgi:hypothetical protein
VSQIGEPFDGDDFAEPCEDCEAPAGALCYPGCPSGYSAQTRQKHAKLLARRDKPSSSVTKEP